VSTRFARYVGIAYSGAEAPVSRLHELQVYASDAHQPPQARAPFDRGARNWCRKEVAAFVRECLAGEAPCIIGIDHGFAFPSSYFRRHELDNWDAFLRHFVLHWPTTHDHMYVDFACARGAPGGMPSELRLCERWTAARESVFAAVEDDVAARATLAGIGWLKALRDERKLRARVHFWPFDGFGVPAGRAVVAEVVPALFQRRYPAGARTPSQQAAYSVSQWLREMDLRGALADYFNPPLSLPERRQAQREGWILGVR
jgi:hypothetical protein